MPSKVINDQSPYERLYGKAPLIKHLRVLGFLCFANNVTKSDKLALRSRESVHMRYSEIHKGYILYDLTSRSFFVSRDIIFKESIFPFSQAKTQQSKALFIDMLDNSNSLFDIASLPTRYTPDVNNTPALDHLVSP